MARPQALRRRLLQGLVRLLGFFLCFRYGYLQDLERIRVVACHHNGMDETRALPPADSQGLAV
jgi:hypothetical protein